MVGHRDRAFCESAKPKFWSAAKSLWTDSLCCEQYIWLRLPLLSVTHCKLVSEEAAECTATPLSLLRQVKLSSGVTLNQIVKVTRRPLSAPKRKDPAQHQLHHLTFTLACIPQLAVFLLGSSRKLSAAVGRCCPQNKATVSAKTGLSADERE